MGATSYVGELTAEQAEKLHGVLENQGWEFSTPPYTRWQAKKDKTSITAYLSGKLTIQGRGTEELVLYTLEPEILNDFSWSIGQQETTAPEDYRPHAGLDESGKGDYFGPLVVACAYVDAAAAGPLKQAGVKDSKAIKSDKKIRELATLIMRTLNGKFAVVTIGPEAYNRLYNKIGNLNRLLAWGHARALENLLEKAPECPAVLADKFGDERLIQRALLERGRQVELAQRTKAESDIAVAAASILARHGFVIALEKMAAEIGFAPPRGAGPDIVPCARRLVAERGAEALAQYVKCHFQTTAKVLAPPSAP